MSIERRTVGRGLIVVAGLLLALGIWSMQAARAGDASIGGGLLLLTAIALAITGFAWWRPLSFGSANDTAEP